MALYELWEKILSKAELLDIDEDELKEYTVSIISETNVIDGIVDDISKIKFDKKKCIVYLTIAIY
jgi:hypothetical protein